MIVTVAALAACSSGTPSDDSSSAAADLTIGSVDLAAAGCPATIVIQTDWNPEAEHGHLYEMFGDDYTVDADKKSVSGPLMSAGEYTGVNLEVRAGGPAIGFSTVSSQMYQDDSITLGYVTTDEAIQLSGTTPTTAVFAPLDKSPIMVMWDPDTYKSVSDVTDLSDQLKASGGVWRYFADSAYMAYLIGSGQVDESVTDSSYDGTPANFVAADGKDVQQGFASAEPYQYENEVTDWGKKVDYSLVADAGYSVYASAVSVRNDDLAGLSDCLKAFVPVMQQAEVDYFAEPATANSLILDLVDQYDTGWVYSQGLADYSVKTMIDQELVSNGGNDTLGDFDADRLSELFDTALPIFTDGGAEITSGLTVDDIYTNDFIDDSIGLK
ncbi:ABC transporter substrate-binding protein [Naasia lichenicola]|uniref:ABC transporter substrate-binding protein n=2 Tax=Naasia lichenicola TaxID=2565933 RepID=A0A4S4FL47_9MICO|nr:ABC transporter substrate-binding protein [Naasia lichenicola]